MTERFRQLILCPEQTDFKLESSELVTILDELGLIGEQIAGPAVGDNLTDSLRFYVGPHFLQHISFMGCAPAIEFQPPNSDNQRQAIEALDAFTFVHVPKIFQQPVWYADLQMAKPACPACNKRVAKPDSKVDKENMSMTCPHCGYQAPLCDFDWREYGGCTQMLISIVNVYPKEAIPSNNLLNQITKRTGVAWRYFYINAPLA